MINVGTLQRWSPQGIRSPVYNLVFKQNLSVVLNSLIVVNIPPLHIGNDGIASLTVFTVPLLNCRPTVRETVLGLNWKEIRCVLTSGKGYLIIIGEIFFSTPHIIWGLRQKYSWNVYSNLAVVMTSYSGTSVHLPTQCEWGWAVMMFYPIFFF